MLGCSHGPTLIYKHMKYLNWLLRPSFFVLALLVLFKNARVQVSGNDRGMAIGMLDMTKDAIKKNYYDPTYHGVDIDFVFEQAKERMKTAPSRDALMMTIASAVLAFDDSHTNFFPRRVPPRSNTAGWSTW